ncbi:MAG: DUF2104 domain-containing protein [Methanobacteriaceae archaeon]|jgi:energy-converting hydrogenase A subunit L|nr:DUF2104 domain-containing protein [Candidatus Methanorudis spinitermitis]
MDSLLYLLYLLAVIIGAVLGLLISYKNHKEAFVINKIDIISLIISIVGWTLLFNYSLIPIFSAITISIGLLLIALVFGMRPGYGRKETLIGIVVSVIIWIFSY